MRAQVNTIAWVNTITYSLFMTDTDGRTDNRIRIVINSAGFPQVGYLSFLIGIVVLVNRWLPQSHTYTS